MGSTHRGGRGGWLVLALAALAAGCPSPPETLVVEGTVSEVRKAAAPDPPVPPTEEPCGVDVEGVLACVSEVGSSEATTTCTRVRTNCEFVTSAELGDDSASHFLVFCQDVDYDGVCEAEDPVAPFVGAQFSSGESASQSASSRASTEKGLTVTKVPLDACPDQRIRFGGVRARFDVGETAAATMEASRVCEGPTPTSPSTTPTTPPGPAPTTTIPATPTPVSPQPPTPIPPSPTPTPTTPAPTPTPPATGNIFIFGGSDGAGIPTANVDVFDGSGTALARTGSLTMLATRSGHTATLLDDGRILIAGGEGSDPGGAEVFDPATQTFASTVDLGGSMMTTPRVEHTATLLADGRVLLAGGQNESNVTLGTAEVFDPITAIFSAVGLLNDPRSGHTANRIDAPSHFQDGQVVIAGGNDFGGVALATIEIFDPDTDTFTRNTDPSNGPGDDMGTPRTDHRATTIPESTGVDLRGTILFTGGQDGVTVHDTAEYFTVEGNEVLPLPLMGIPRMDHTSTLVMFPGAETDLTVLITGGSPDGVAPTDDVEKFVPDDPSTPPPDGARFVPLSSGATLTIERMEHVAIPLASGLVFIAGGEDAVGPTATTEVFDPAANSFVASGPMSMAVTGHAVVEAP